MAYQWDFSIGYVKDATGSYVLGMGVLCICLAFSGCVALGVRRRRMAILDPMCVQQVG